MKRIRVFLGGYINYTNAQNINCKDLAEHLNNNKYQVFSLQTCFGDQIDLRVNTFFCFRPFRASKHIGFLWGLLKCDVAYLPKHVDTPLWVLRLAKILKKPIFTTIEGNVKDKSLPNLVDLFGSEYKMKKHFSYITKIFGITNFIKVNTASLINMQDKILHLGVNINNFTPSRKLKLGSVVFVGSLIKRKNVQEFIDLARCYPNLCFNLIGDGEMMELLKVNSTNNIIFHGSLTHAAINDIFKLCDLIFLPSKSEGFPKVILEAASAGIPAVVYNTYGASEWIKNEHNGYIVNDINEVMQLIDKLIERPDLLEKVSKNALKLANKFSWKFVIKSWEKVIENLYYAK